MSTIQNANIFTMYIPLAAHQTAQRFRAHQANPVKGKQVYLNTLAVYVTHTYLKVLGIRTDLTKSISWDPISHSLLDTGALHVKDQGQLECRPVLPHEESCYIPTDAWSDRLGYVAVQLDTQLQQATLVGFLAKASEEQVRLSKFAQLDSIFDHLANSNILAAASEDIVLDTTMDELIQCQQWFNQIFTAGWVEIDNFLPSIHTTSKQSEPAFRGLLDTNIPWTPPTPPTNGIMGAKLLERSGQRMALCVGLSKNPREHGEMNISVELYPVNGNGVLPENTTLSVLDATGKVVVESQPVCDVTYKFIGESGEQFSVRISLGNENEFGFLETFLI